MSELLVTQCPYCQTRFRLTPEQLRVASGHVRCGACLEVFQAADAAPDTPRQASAAQPHTPEPDRQPPPPARDPLLEYDLDEPDLAALGLDESLIREVNPDMVPEQLAIQEQTPAAPPAAELHEDFLSTPPARDFGPDFDHQRSGLGAVLPDEASYADKGIFQRDQPEPVAAPAEADAGAAPAEQPELPAEATEADEPAQPAPAAEAETAETTETAEVDSEEIRFAPDAPPLSSDERAEPTMPPLGLELLEEELLGEAPVRRRRRTGLWTTLTLLALLALPTQYLFYNFDALARNERSRPMLENLCLLARCELPARVDISRIRSTNLLVRPDPEFPSALAIDVILYNRADFAQPFPVLEMQFSDATGRPVASRRFRPEEYLAGELAGVSLMPSQTPIHVGLSMLDPGQQARSYRLEFLSP